MANGCTATADVIAITQNITAPTAGITNNTSTTVLTYYYYCLSASLLQVEVLYPWSNSLGTAAAVSVTAPNTYTVTVTGANGCTATATAAITQNITAPTAGITNNYRHYRAYLLLPLLSALLLQVLEHYSMVEQLGHQCWLFCDIT